MYREFINKCLEPRKSANEEWWGNDMSLSITWLAYLHMSVFCVIIVNFKSSMKIYIIKLFVPSILLKPFATQLDFSSEIWWLLQAWLCLWQLWSLWGKGSCFLKDRLAIKTEAVIKKRNKKFHSCILGSSPMFGFLKYTLILKLKPLF